MVSALALATVAIAATWLGGLPFAVLWALAGACVVAEWLLLIGPRAQSTGAPADASSQPEHLPVTRQHSTDTNSLTINGPAGGRRLAALRLLAAAGVGALPLLVELALPVAATVSAAAALTAAAAWVVLAFRAGGADADWRRRFGDLLVVWVAGGLACGALAGLVPVLARGVAEWGVVLIAWMFAVVWTTDIAAYFTGRAIGGPKLWPRVSPNKTWAGFWGGTVGGALAGWAVSLAAAALTGGAPFHAGTVLAVSFAASILGQGGDLAESALKRRAGVKDSGRIIPGHGGVLDRVDSFLAVCLLVAIGLASGVVAVH